MSRALHSFCNLQCYTVIEHSYLKAQIAQESIRQDMEVGTDDWVVADSEDEEGFRPLPSNQSGLLSGNPYSTDIASISERQ